MSKRARDFLTASRVTLVCGVATARRPKLRRTLVCERKGAQSWPVGPLGWHTLATHRTGRSHRSVATVGRRADAQGSAAQVAPYAPFGPALALSARQTLLGLTRTHRAIGSRGAPPPERLGWLRVFQRNLRLRLIRPQIWGSHKESGRAGRASTRDPRVERASSLTSVVVAPARTCSGVTSEGAQTPTNLFALGSRGPTVGRLAGPQSRPEGGRGSRRTAAQNI